MTLTVLAIAFLFLILLVTVFGQKLLSQKAQSVQEANREQCAICRNEFDKTEMIERQIGDFKILYFCKQCIESLYADLSARNHAKA